MTSRQKEIIAEWEAATSCDTSKFWEIAEVFSARNNQDNARRRTMYLLCDQGRLVTESNGLGYIPKVKGGNPLK